eukprot:8772957-Pyramimonas_sp.AAC.1
MPSRELSPTRKPRAMWPAGVAMSAPGSDLKAKPLFSTMLKEASTPMGPIDYTLPKKAGGWIAVSLTPNNASIPFSVTRQSGRHFGVEGVVDSLRAPDLAKHPGVDSSPDDLRNRSGGLRAHDVAVGALEATLLDAVLDPLRARLAAWELDHLLDHGRLQEPGLSADRRA